jgi:hypothetical protein
VGVRDGLAMRFRHGLVEGGVATRHYFEAKRINDEVRALASALAGFRSVAATSEDLDAVLSSTPLRITGDPLSAGVFRDRSGATAVLVVNRRYDAPARVVLRPTAEGIEPRLFDPRTRHWQAIGDAVTVAPGGALLLRWREPPPRRLESAPSAPYKNGPP